MTDSSYRVVSGLVFAAVAAAHLLRALAGWPIVIGGWDAPLAASWAAALGAGALAAWALRPATRRG